MRRRAGGFTFVEMLVALSVGVLVLAGMYQAFNTLHKWWLAASVTADQRQNARTGLETVTRDLEMAGYQTTGYGDVNKTGIAVTLAAAGEIEMDQQRPRGDTIADPEPVYEPRLVYYHLATDVKSGRQHLYRQTRTQPGLPAVDEIVAENVAAFSLAYYDRDGAPVAGLPPAAPGGSAAYVVGTAVPAGSPLRAIRRIDVTITTAPARAAAFGPAARNFTMTASVTPQNLATVDEVTVDLAPPAVPTGLAVVDTRSCGAKLRVRWSRSTDPDLAGYLVFSGPTLPLMVPVTALANPAGPEITLNPAALLITKNADRATAPNTYAIQVAAYDSSGNHSARSGAASGNPDPDVTAFGGADDSTVNPVKPAAPTGMAVVAGAADGELVVSWQAPADGTATAGFRLYRSASAFADGHVDESLRIAGEADLGPGATSWTDRGLEGCRTYHYAVASVNCDETLVATYLHDADTPAAGDYAAGSGVPLDRVPPPAPSLAGTQAELQRLLVTLTNPLEIVAEDFVRTELFWSKAPAAAPQLDAAAGTVSGGAHVPDTDAGSDGVFTRRGSQVVLFDSESFAEPVDPELDAGGTYHLLAVSYDRCGNASAPAAATLTVLSPPTPCPDETDPAEKPPAAFGSPTYTSCQADAVEIGWSYPDRTTVPDLEGFRITRTGTGPSVELTAGPTLARAWTDAGPLTAGGEYSWTVEATDCSWEQYLLHGVPLPYVGLLNSLTIGPVYPGGLGRYEPLGGTDHELDPENFVVTLSDDPAAHTYHNNVRLWLQNTSRSPVTIKRMAVAWDRTGVVLDRIVVGGAPSGTTEQIVDADGAASGAAFTVNATVADVAGGVGDPSGAVPVLLRFTNPDGSVSRFTDLRGETLELSLWTRNESLQDAACLPPERIAVDAPRGPVLGGFSQSAPGRYGIDAYAVIGPSGTARDTDVKVPYGIDVNVFGTAFDNSRDLFADGVNRGFAALKVVGIAAAAASPAAVPVMPASGTFFERPLWSVGGDRYAVFRTAPTTDGAPLPGTADAVTWYYALAVDATGNWDRVPNPDFGSYAYFQPPFDLCAATPRAPVLTLLSADATGAVLGWSAPTEYVDGIAILAGDTLTYDVYVKSAGGDPWPPTPAGADLAGTTWTHAADLLAGTYSYMVVAKNSCAAAPRASAESNTVMECEGTAGVSVDCTLFAVPGAARYDDPIRLAASGICAYRGNGAADSVVFRVTGDGTTSFTAPETGDEGAFEKAVTAVWSAGGADTVVARSGSLVVDLVVAGATPCASRTVALAGGECFTTPNPPTSFTAARGAMGSGAAVLTWVRPNYNTDGSSLTDLAGYEIEHARCAVFNAGSGNCTTWSAWTGTVLNDPAAQGHTWSGLVIGERYKFRMRAKDVCTTPNLSAYTAESGVVRVR